MTCPDCEYVLSPFDKECPRCKAFTAKGKSAPKLTVISPELVVPTSAPGAQSVYAQPPADSPKKYPASEKLSSATVVVVSARRNYIPLAFVPFAVVALIAYLGVSSSQQMDQRDSIIDAAAEGLPMKLGATGPMTDKGHDYWVKQAHDWHASIVMDGDNKADVSFYDWNSNALMDHETVTRDTDGIWHAQ